MQKFINLLFVIIITSLSCCNKEMKDEREFVLKWEDSFDTLNTERWRLSEHGFPGNLSFFIPENVRIVEGKLRLIARKENYNEFNYTSGEVYSNEEFLYGKFVARMKPADGRGLVSAFFTFTSIAPNHEIDIEMLGKNNSFITTNYWTSAENKYAKVYELDFNASSEFADFVIEWTPYHIKWFVNDRLIRTTEKDIPTMPQRIYMNLWISENAEWVGEVDNGNLPVHAEFDYVKYFAYE